MLRSGGVRPAAAARLPAARLQGRGRLRVLAGASISSNDFKPGVFIEVDGAPFKVVEVRRRKAACAAVPPPEPRLTRARAL